MIDLPFILLGITAVSTFCFGLLVKMYKTNLVGFAVICYVFFNVLNFLFSSNAELVHLYTLSGLLWFICLYNFYKHYIKYRR